jgi:deoxyadenosine/deoxycytidine kinase
MSHYFVAIAGNIGAGKSTLTGLLADHFDWQPFYEANAENPYLADFYQDMNRWSFHSQVFFLGKRLEHHRQLLDFPGSVVQDRTIYEDAEIFAANLYKQGHMAERDYAAYRNLYKAISSFLPPPDLIIYLQASTETLLKHISDRGREFERDIKPEYIDQLNTLYNNWIDNWTLCPVMRVPMDQIDFLRNGKDLKGVLAEVREHLAEKTPGV